MNDRKGPDSLRFEKTNGDASKREEIGRIVRSGIFRERDSLKRLLVYLAERSLDGSADALKEYTVGVEVFHKPDDYDPQKDASVRQHIGKLRQKLHEYYRTEGSADPIRVELPMRQFRFVFHDAASAPPLPRAFPWRWLAIVCVVLLPAAFWAGSRWRAGSGDELDPAVRLLWAPFLDSGRPAVACLGTPLFLRNRSFRVRGSHLNDTDSPESQARIRDLEKTLGLSFSPSFDYTGIGEAFAAVGVAELFARAHREIAVTRSNVLSWNEIKNGNVIFLGPPKFNPHVAAIPMQAEFLIGDSLVTNAHPRPGERATYYRVDDANRDATEDYAVISRVPSIDPAGRILILEGLSTSSPWAAADYITRAPTARELIAKMKSADGRIPAFFQVLLRVRYRSMVPTQTSFVAFRALNASNSTQ